MFGRLFEVVELIIKLLVGCLIGNLKRTAVGIKVLLPLLVVVKVKAQKTTYVDLTE